MLNNTQLKEALAIIGNLDFRKAIKIICDGSLSEQEKKEIQDEKNKTVDVYRIAFEKIDEKVVDPEHEKAIVRNAIYESIKSHKDSFEKLRGYPNDWRNTNLFAELWGLASLLAYWDEPEIPPMVKLLSNPNIPIKILDLYFSLVRQPTKADQVPSYYSGELKWFNQPFPISVEGAYPLKDDFDWLEFKIKEKHKPEYNQETVWEYLKLFAKGFKQGYFNFENDILKTSIFQDQINMAQKTFDYASSFFNNGRGNFPEFHDGRKHIFSCWDESGKKAGYYYRAWYLILENHKMFEQFFPELSPNQNSIQSFEGYLIKESKRLLPKLKSNYSTPKKISLMVLALDKNQQLTKGWNDNLSDFHKVLRADFPKIGEYENLRGWVRDKADQMDVINLINQTCSELNNL